MGVRLNPELVQVRANAFDVDDLRSMMHRRLGHLVETLAREQEAGNADEPAWAKYRDEADQLATMLNALSHAGFPTVNVSDMLAYEARRY